MEDISIDKISQLLSSPDLMKNVQAVLGQMGMSNAEKPDIIVENTAESTSESKSADSAEAAAGLSNLISSIGSFLSQNKTERIALLTALRPFLSDEKKSLVDSILQILKVANVFLASNMLK